MMKMNSLCFLIVLMVVGLAVGCVKQHQGLAGGRVFEVDGIEYWVDRYADVDQQGRVASSTLIVSHYVNGGSASGIYVMREYTKARGTTIVTLHSDAVSAFKTKNFRDFDGEYVVAKTDTLYFAHEGIIVFEKEYQELGIDASRLNADNKVMLDYLQPILEKLIRENVTPQEDTTEEQ